MNEDDANVQTTGQVETSTDGQVEAEQAENQAPAEQAENADAANAPEQTNDEDAEFDSTLPQGGEQDQSVQTDDEGNVIDATQFKESIKQEMRQEVQFERQEQRAWGRLEEKYPEIKDDKDLREMILASRIMDVQNGGNGSLISAGNKVMQKFSGARSAGKTDAQVSIKNQKTAGVSRSSAPRSDNQSSDTMDKIRSGDRQAQQDVIAGWIEQGKL